MKVVFIEAKYKEIITLPKALIDALPKKVALFTSIQFSNSQQDMKNQVEERGREVVLPLAPHSKYAGHLLGCGIKEFGEEFDAFLYVGDGVFHPQTLVVENKKPVFVFDPFDKTGNWTKLDISIVDQKLKRKQGSLAKFYAAQNVGVLVSTKPGQNFLRYAMKLKELYPEKNFYFIINNNIDFSQLENFPFVECWVNTACPRIGIDDVYKFHKAVVNLDDVAEGILKTSIAYKAGLKDEKTLAEKAPSQKQ